jgi:hypothetical protein
MLASIRTWISHRSGVALLALLAGVSVALAALVPVVGKLAAGIVTTLYLAWLGWASFELRACGRGRWHRPVPEAALVVLVGFAVLVYPFALDVDAQTLLSNEALGTAARGAFAISLLFVCDHIAAAFAQEQESWGRRLSAYALAVLLLLIPPFAVLLLHGRITALTGSHREGRGERLVGTT